ncbi:hypothetical protein BD324DRAFT_522658 [Kockovaella imperatae]|uniref:Uncharacterized protein n=1 Tax=Kockovaella imperatae TaxID=4999 RepID=A0A1Y1UG96_9TREE|nr:hypothetical protein BD324DRAFT_522658 [Kockovaella imperatae]ORX36085.1 hypothetical protein BD324DRAFT_522658 [Kockovaella imperatae]
MPDDQYELLHGDPSSRTSSDSRVDEASEDTEGTESSNGDDRLVMEGDYLPAQESCTRSLARGVRMTFKSTAGSIMNGLSRTSAALGSCADGTCNGVWSCFVPIRTYHTISARNYWAGGLIQSAETIATCPIMKWDGRPYVDVTVNGASCLLKSTVMCPFVCAGLILLWPGQSQEDCQDCFCDCCPDALEEGKSKYPPTRANDTQTVVREPPAPRDEVMQTSGQSALGDTEGITSAPT